MLVQLTCSGGKLLPCPVTGCQSKMIRNPSLRLPHCLHHHRLITLCLLPLPSSTTINFPRPLGHNVVVVHLVFKIDPLTTRAAGPHHICPRLTPLAHLLHDPISHLVDSEDLGMVQKPCGTQSLKRNCGST